MDSKHILIIGAGVSGLSVGTLLLKEGFGVTIWAKDMPLDTTSSKAGAFWYPYLSKPKNKVTRWARVTREYLLSSGIQGDPSSGCELRSMTELLASPGGKPWWNDSVDSFRRPTQAELPTGYVDGYQLEAPLFDTSMYLDYLLSKYLRLGGNIIQKNVTDVNEALEDYSIVVNCAGLGSRELFNDELVYPIRGQTIRVKPNGASRIVFDDDGPNSVAIIVPRTRDIVLGTTVQANDWNTDIDPNDTRDILQKCAKIDPRFTNVEIIGESVGLRPARDEIRLEAQDLDGRTVIHNYGHGGSGFTLSWGCALEVLDLVIRSSNIYA